MIGMGGFDSLNSDRGRPMPGPMPRLGGPGGMKPVGPDIGGPSPSSGPVSAPKTPAPASSMPYGQSHDPAGYGAPGAPGSSPLGMWQSWLNTMGPYLAQQPTSEPMAESGGLSSLAPSSSTPGTMHGYAGPDTPWQGNRGFRLLNMA